MHYDDPERQARHDAQILAYARWRPEWWGRLIGRLSQDDPEQCNDLTQRAARAAQRERSFP